MRLAAPIIGGRLGKEAALLALRLLSSRALAQLKLKRPFQVSCGLWQPMGQVEKAGAERGQKREPAWVALCTEWFEDLGLGWCLTKRSLKETLAFSVSLQMSHKPAS